jgi:hypothetical protein
MSDRENSGSDKQVHVVDRRRFDSTGKERGDEPAESQSQPVATDSAISESAASTATLEGDLPPGLSASEAAKSAAAFRMEAGPEEESVSFTSFVMSLATQSMVHMGEMQAPAGMDIPLDLESSRQTIDILGMLQRKTRGNLSSEEARFIEEVLHTLRMSYVRRKRG